MTMVEQPKERIHVDPSVLKDSKTYPNVYGRPASELILILRLAEAYAIEADPKLEMVFLEYQDKAREYVDHHNLLTSLQELSRVRERQGRTEWE